MATWWMLLACSDHMLIGDTSAPNGPETDAVDTAPHETDVAETDAGDTDDTDSAGCPPLVATWAAPYTPARIALEAEIRDERGSVAIEWVEWASETGTDRVSASIPAGCHGAARWVGTADLTGDGTNDAWACMRQSSTAGDYAIIGVPTCRVGDRDVTPEIRAAGEGCELWCAW